MLKLTELTVKDILTIIVGFLNPGKFFYLILNLGKCWSLGIFDQKKPQIYLKVNFMVKCKFYF